MKKYQLLLCLLILCSYQAFSQNSKWSVGIEGGPGLRTLKSKNTYYSQGTYSLNYTFGDFIEYHFKGKFSLKADLLLEKKGGRTYIPNLPAGIKTFFNTNYLVIPLLGKFSFGHKLKLFVNAGPYVGILLGQGPNDAPIENFDLGLTTGMGLTVPLNEHIFINTEIRNNLGLYNINTFLNSPDTPSVKNITFNLLTGIGYRF